MKLYVLDGGTIEILDWSLFQPDAGKGVRRTLADSCYLVVHPRGTLVWDTGLSDALAEEPDGHRVGDIAVFRVDDSLERQLSRAGCPADTVDFLALSHFHPDHVGNTALFPGATLFVQRDEYAAAFGTSPGDHGFDPGNYAHLREQPVHTLDGDHDVFGDGSVVILRLPGHTPGSQSLLVRLPDTGPVLISGDLVHSLENWARRVVPALNADADESLRSMDRAADVLAEEGAVLWVQHDHAQQSALRRLPHHYT
ncbi:N-acyl homoserine lactonase family protein [Streptomyces sp. NPDC005963]|uniref:N-acyl homoserine lactonase family protein n=1 Tax=Streptomyces sp. NPDC005963 TaxID=3156721 RepID=UPI0033E02BC8